MRKIINITLILALLAGLCVPATAAGTAFTDVPAGNWAHSFVQRAADQGWVSGVGGGRYAPNSHVTYGQFAVMLGNAIYPSDMAAQSKTGQWWEPACMVAAQHNLWKDTDMLNRSTWNSTSGKAIPREQMAQMMYNALADVGAKLPSYEEYSEVALGINDIIDTDNDDAVATCYAMGLLSGNGNGYFNPHDPMTRAQAAVVLCRMYDTVQGGNPDSGKPSQPVETPTVQVYDGGKVIGLRFHVRNEVEDNPQCNCKFYFTIEPKEDYPTVIMPDDTTAVIEGTGDATFKEIRFTAPGTYSFEIYAEEGLEHYRYDARSWEVTVTVTGTAGAPFGAVGGQYDVSAHDVPADTNKDGWITESEVQAVLAQLRVEYPHGSEWGLHTRYPGRPDGKGMGSGTACAGFAKMVSDRIFGTLPYYVVALENTRVGDILMNDQGEGHDNIVLNDYGKDMFEGVNYTDSYTTVDGNSSGTVYWGGVHYYADWPAGVGSTRILSRYPAGTNTPSTIALDSAVYTRGDTTTTDGASFITTCLDTPTWSAETKERARKIMAGMTLEEKVGQLFMLHYPGDGSGTAAQAADLIDKYHPGGYLVFANMFENSTPTAVRQKIADTQAASDIPLLFTVDEEGGKVVRISDKSQYGHEKFKSPQELKAAGGLAAVAADTIDKAAFLKDLGLNVNYAPVADTAGPSGYMYARTWGGDGLENAKYVETLVEAAEGTGVGTTVKHFPGYGGTSANTHNGFAVNELTLDDFYYNDLLPFHAGIAAGGRAVMVTHNTINCLDPTNPASLSPAVYQMLRDSNEANFDGVAMTDDLSMQAVTNFVGTGQASLRALQAGADMAMTSTPDRDVPVVLAAVNNGSFSLSDVEAKCLRILCWKLDLGLIQEEEVPPTPPDPEDYEAKYIGNGGMTEQTGSFAAMWALAEKNGGKVELYKDASFASGLSVPYGKNIELDLMGHTLTYTNSRDAINVFSGAVFTLSDSAGEITKTPLASPSADTLYSNRRLVYNEAAKDGTSVAETEYAVDFSRSGALAGSGANSLIYLEGGAFNLSGGILENPGGPRAVNAVHNSANTIHMTGGGICLGLAAS